MELIRNTLHMNKTVCENHFSITIDEDITIPENKGPIEHKIKELGEVCIEKIRPLEERCSVGGELYFGLLYHSESGCQSYYGKIPFEETFSIKNVTAQDIVRGKATLLDLKISMVNSHKISVRAVVSVKLTVQVIYDKEALCGIEMEGIQCKKMDKKMLSFMACKRETVRVRESINIDRNMPDIGEIIWSDLHIEDFKTVAMDGKINFSGNLAMFAIYCGENENTTNYFSAKIPFSSNVEFADGRADDIYDVNFLSTEKSLICRNDENGESRILDGEIIYTLEICSYREKNVSVLCDMYAPRYEFKPQIENVGYESFMTKNNIECSVEEAFSNTASGSVMYTIGDAYIEDVVREDKKINVIGVINANIFIDTGDEKEPVNLVVHEIPFSKSIEIEDFDVDCILDTKLCNLKLTTKTTGQGELTIYCGYTIEVFVKKAMNMPIITNVETVEISKEKFKMIPGITGYIVKPGDTLWSIAKKYCTTVDAIMEANGLESDEIYPGMKLIILKLYCF